MGGTSLGVGDVNGDGLADFIIGSNVDSNSVPSNYLVYGSAIGYNTLLPAGGDDADGRVYLGGPARFDQLGDVNGDGFDDWLYQPVSDTFFYPDDDLDQLDAYIVLGQANAYASPFDIGQVDAVRLPGTYPEDSNYTSRVYPVGDINGDDYADVLVIEPVDYGQESATAWLITGRAGELPESIDPASVPASQTITIRFPNPDYGRYEDYVVPPWEVRPEIGIQSDGDINGDGIDDILILDSWNAGPSQTYAVFGSAAGLPTLIDKDMLDGSNGYWLANNRVDGIEDGRREFSDIALLDDTDGDGIDDILIDTRSAAAGPGIVYVVPGRSTWPQRLDVSTLPSISLFSVQGSGWNPIANAGDINGDGLGDWLMGLDNYSPSGVGVIYGQSGPVDDMVLDDIESNRGFAIQPTLRMDDFSNYGLPWASADIGDSNGDGIDDLLLGDDHTLGPIENWTDYLDEYDVYIHRTGLVALILGRQDQGGPSSPASFYPAYARQLIELRWTLSDTEDINRIELYRDASLIASLDPEMRRFEDTAAARDTDYTYEVVTVDSAGQRSAPTFLTARNDYPHYPTLAGEVYSSTLAELFWVDDGNNPFFGNREYDIYRDGEHVGTRRALSWLDENYTPTGHHYVIDTNPERYRSDYRLRSDELYLPPDAGTRAPASVGNPRVELLSPDTVRVSWDVAAWGVEPLRYELVGVGTTTETSIIASVAYSDYGLQFGGTIVTIDANDRRSSPMPFYVYLTEPLRALLPREPIDANATQVTESELTLTWNLDPVGTQPTGFEIMRDYEVVAQTESATYTDSGLEADALYRYEIRSLDGDGHRSLSRRSEVLRVLTAGGPFLPTELRALAYGPTIVEVLWERAQSGYSTVTAYEVYRDGELLDTVDALSLMDEDLEPGTTYTYEVRSIGRGAAGASEIGPTTTVTTPEY